MENIQSKYAELFKSSCYAFCLCYVFSGTTNEWKWLELISKGVQNGDITEDCYVQKPLDFIKMLCGTKYRDVNIVEIKQLESLPDGPQIVELKNPFGGSHFVVCNNKGELLFDASFPSKSWEMCLPISYRRFI